MLAGHGDDLHRHGATVGEKFDPFQRVGIYIPGGTAPLVSMALMTITPAKVAGCAEIVVCTPCGKDGSINPALLFAAREYGTKTIRPVQKVFGPGNAYVVTAKRLLVGYVAIDLLPGPSEVLVLATLRPIQNLPPPTCWPKPNTAPVTKVSGW